MVHRVRERERLEVARVVDLPSLIVRLGRGLDKWVVSSCKEDMRIWTRGM